MYSKMTSATSGNETVVAYGGKGKKGKLRECERHITVLVDGVADAVEKAFVGVHHDDVIDAALVEDAVAAVPARLHHRRLEHIQQRIRRRRRRRRGKSHFLFAVLFVVIVVGGQLEQQCGHRTGSPPIEFIHYRQGTALIFMCGCATFISSYQK